MKNTVWIAGASVAGPTAAYWLAHGGFGVTVVERSSSLRLGGQNIDISGAGFERMGIEAASRDNDTGDTIARIIASKPVQTLARIFGGGRRWVGVHAAKL